MSDFVAGPENRLIVAAIESVLAEAASLYNPLVLYGPSGCGKSHLAHGLGRWWRRHYRGQQTVLLSGAEFAEQLAQAVNRQEVDRWRKRLRAADLLVVEDIGSLASKPSAQQELWRTLDAIWEHDGFVVVTARSLPAQLTTLVAALRSRLSSGLSIPVALPGPAARRTMLERFAAGRGIRLEARACQALADRLPTSAVGLLAAVMDLQLRWPGANIDVREVSQFVAERAGGERPTISAIAGRVAKFFGFKVADLKSPLRRQSLVAARGVAMYLAHELADKSLAQIGAYFGGRDHTTVLHACRRTEKLLKKDPATREAVAELKQVLVPV